VPSGTITVKNVKQGKLMEKPSVLYYKILQYQEKNLQFMRKAFRVVELKDPAEDTAQILKDMDGVFAPLGFQLGAPKMDLAPRLRVVISNTTSIPHIDVEEAAKRGITICALHDERGFLNTITPTAEHTIGLMLAAWRRIPAAHAFVLEGRWNRRPWGAPAMMSRLRLGIVGYGRLGQMVAEIASAMKMDWKFYDPHVASSVADVLSLARQSDILTLHAPALPNNFKMISREVLEALPRGAMVVNTARGELLDTDALLDLLEQGHLAAAALDVIDGEYAANFVESFPNSRLIQYARTHQNLLLTPHIGGSTLDAWYETERFVIDKAVRVLRRTT
jgi:D-3-phosphoglycerate dehydrogenase